MTDKIYLNSNELTKDSFRLAKKIYDSGFNPDVIIGLWRGGTPVGIAVHEFLHYKGVNCYHTAVKTSSYTGIDQHGATVIENLEPVLKRLTPESRVLIVDDIFDSGNTAAAVKERVTVKRFDLLIRQFARIHNSAPDWKLKILGDGEDAAALREQVRELGAEDYILLAGRKNGREVEEEMCRASLFAMSSRSEGFPFVLLEAQSCALPILAYDVRVGPGFMVHEGEDGYLVPEGDEALFERRLLEMMGAPRLLREMGEKALEHAGEFSEDKVAEKWYSVIET